MRTQSGRCSYCFKADRFIYCPNNLVESWSHRSVLNCAPLKLTRHPMHFFLAMLLAGFYISRDSLDMA